MLTGITEHALMQQAMHLVREHLLVGARMYVIGVGLYLLVLFSLYSYGKNYRSKFSRVLDELKRSRGAVERLEKKAQSVHRWRSWVSFLYILLTLLVLTAVAADTYLRLPYYGSWMLSLQNVVNEFETILISSGLSVLVLMIISKVLGHWELSVSQEKVTAVTEQEGFVERLLKTLDPSIVFALYQNVDKQNIRTKLKDTQQLIVTKTEECNRLEHEIGTKKQFIDSYVNFMRGVAEMDWCQDCITGVTSRKDISSAQELPDGPQTQERTDDFRRQDSMVLVCTQGCMLKCQKYLKEFERKLKEEVEQISTRHDTKGDTYRTEETEADLQEFGIDKHF